MLDFIHFLEKLKKEMRHSYLSDGRQEDVAQHSWRMGLMAMTIIPEENVDVSRCVKMALVHDLPEAIAGDVFALDVTAKKGKHERELNAMKEICTKLENKNIGNELFSLWNEYEEAATAEARFVKLLDKLEVLIQHNESPIETWAEIEKRTHFGMASLHAKKYGMLKEFAEQIDNETFEKLSKHGLQPERLTQAEFEQFFGKK